MRASPLPTPVSEEESTEWSAESGPEEGDPHEAAPGEDAPGVGGAQAADSGGSTVDWLLGGPDEEGVPTVDPPDASDAPGDLRVQFWSVVLVVNAGVLAVALGAMLVGFRGAWRPGAVLMVAGGLLLARAYRRTRAIERERAASTEEQGDGGTRGSSDPAGTPGAIARDAPECSERRPRD